LILDQLFDNGIIGIVAGKIVQKYRKPAIVIAGSGVGSARSISDSGFSIINVIEKSGCFLIKNEL
jgi:single-stranded DNA-specific DHH superfamily exonuclease